MTIGNSVGGVLNYVCDEGFLLVGSMMRTCQMNGTWTGDDPICEGMRLVFCYEAGEILLWGHSSSKASFILAIFLPLFCD